MCSVWVVNLETAREAKQDRNRAGEPETAEVEHREPGIVVRNEAREDRGSR